MIEYSRTFRYETELQRVDAPQENVADWIDTRAVNDACRARSGLWDIARTELRKQPDGSYNYTVTMRLIQ